MPVEHHKNVPISELVARLWRGYAENLGMVVVEEDVVDVRWTGMWSLRAKLRV